MKRYPKILFLNIFIFFLLSTPFLTDDVLSENSSEDFPKVYVPTGQAAGFRSDDPGTEDFPIKIYVPIDHSWPIFLKKWKPEPVSPIKKISISNPDIAEVKIITPYELVIDGKGKPYTVRSEGLISATEYTFRGVGSTTLIVWYEDNSVDFFEIRVTSPHPAIQAKMEVIRGINSSGYGYTTIW